MLQRKCGRVRRSCGGPGPWLPLALQSSTPPRTDLPKREHVRTGGAVRVPSTARARACVRACVTCVRRCARSCMRTRVWRRGGGGGGNLAQRAPRPRRVKSKHKRKSLAAFRARGARPPAGTAAPAGMLTRGCAPAPGRNDRVGTDMTDRRGRGGTPYRSPPSHRHQGSATPVPRHPVPNLEAQRQTQSCANRGERHVPWDNCGRIADFQFETRRSRRPLSV